MVSGASRERRRAVVTYRSWAFGPAPILSPFSGWWYLENVALGLWPHLDLFVFLCLC